MYPTAPDSPAFSITKSKRSQSPFRRSSGPIKKRKVVIQQRPRVRFNEEVEAFKPRVFKTPLMPHTTWLKEKDLTKIRDGVFSTLAAMKKKRDCGVRWTEANERKHCSRGLEDYSIDNQGSLKASTVHRRQNAIRAVLHEQEMQLQRHRQLQARASKKIQQKEKAKPLHHSVLDHVKLSRVYLEQTEPNIHEAISMGRIDSEQALAIYSEPPQQQQQQQQQQRRRPSLPSTKMPVTTNPKAKKLESTWGFATTPMTAQAPPLSRPQHLHRRVVSVS